MKAGTVVDLPSGTANSHYGGNRSPLLGSRMVKVAVGSVRPEGRQWAAQGERLLKASRVEAVITTLRPFPEQCRAHVLCPLSVPRASDRQRGC